MRRVSLLALRHYEAVRLCSAEERLNYMRFSKDQRGWIYLRWRPYPFPPLASPTDSRAPAPPHGRPMQISRITPQLRTTDLAASIEFYTAKLGFTLEFQHQDFYAGLRCGSQSVHLKLVDEPDPSIAFVERDEHFHLYLETRDVAGVAEALKGHGVPLVRDVHETAWGTRECIVRDNVGHTLYFGERQ